MISSLVPGSHHFTHWLDLYSCTTFIPLESISSPVPTIQGTNNTLIHMLDSNTVSTGYVGGQCIAMPEPELEPTTRRLTMSSSTNWTMGMPHYYLAELSWLCVLIHWNVLKQWIKRTKFIMTLSKNTWWQSTTITTRHRRFGVGYLSKWIYQIVLIWCQINRWVI